MKPGTITNATAVSMAVFLISSCNPQDPSAVSEGQKALAEALAKNIHLTEEIAQLKTELEDAKTKVSESEAVRMPSRAEVEKMLDLEGSKLKNSAREQSPGSEVMSFSTSDLNIPSFDRPFSCKAKLVLKSSDSSTRTLYWLGSANMKGEWTFTKTENWEPKVIAPVVEPPKVAEKTEPKNEHDINFDGPPVLEPPAQKPKKQTPPPPPPVREKPKPKYDIPLDRPVLGPGSR